MMFYMVRIVGSLLLHVSMEALNHEGYKNIEIPVAKYNEDNTHRGSTKFE